MMFKKGWSPSRFKLPGLDFFRRYRSLFLRIGFTIFILTLFQIGTTIRVPSVTWSDQTNSQNDFFVLLSLFGGGTLKQLSIFALGVSPFITASIIVQLLASGLIPKLKEWRQQGQTGQRKINYLTKSITVPLAFLQSIGVIAALATLENVAISSGPFSEGLNKFFFIPLMWTAGTMIAIFIADLISSKGIGNGVSLIIFTGILTSTFAQSWEISKIFLFGPGISGAARFLGFFKVFAYFLVLYFLITFILFISKAERRIPIQQTGQGLRLRDHHRSYLPLKLNVTGVVPVIFASSLISFLQAIAAILDKKGKGDFLEFYNANLALTTFKGLAIFACLVFLASMLYTTISLDTEQLAINLRRSGGYILGIQSGEKTQNYVFKVLIRLNFFGSLYLSFLSVLSPFITWLLFSNQAGSSVVNGISLLLLVIIGENVYNQIKYFMTQIRYVNFVRSGTNNFLWKIDSKS